MKLAQLKNPKTLIKVIIGLVVVGSIGAYMVMKVIDTNWSNWLSDALKNTINDIKYETAEENRLNVLNNFDLPKTIEYKTQNYDVTWNESSAFIEFKDNGSTLTVQVTRQTTDQTVEISGEIIRNGLVVNKKYEFKIKAA